MKTEIWVMIVLIGLLVGFLIGYGIWGPQAAQVPALERRIDELTARVEELTEENKTLKTSLEQTPSAPPVEIKITGGG